MEDKGTTTLIVFGVLIVILITAVGAYYFGTRKNTNNVKIDNTEVKIEKDNNTNKLLDAVTPVSKTQTPVINKTEIKTPPIPNVLKTEESLTEIFYEQPGVIKSVKSGSNNKWILEIDILGNNPNWVSGSSEDFFINQNPKIRNLNLTTSTKIKNCTSQNIGYVSGFKNEMLSLINYIKYRISKSKTDPSYIDRFGYTAFFDIKGKNIVTIYELCLE